MILRSFAVLFLCLLPAARTVGQTYFESVDAGHRGVQFAEPCYAGFNLTRINGFLNTNDRADAYVIQVTSSPFIATTEGLAGFDTQLFLLNMDGTAIVSNDDFGAPGVRTSNITVSLALGFYILAISPYDFEPVDAAGVPLFTNNITGLNADVGGRRVWTDFLPVDGTTPGGGYGIALSGANYVSFHGPRTFTVEPGTIINTDIDRLSYGDTILLPPGVVFLSSPISNSFTRGRAFNIKGSGQFGECEIRPAPGTPAFPAVFMSATRDGPLTLFENLVFSGFSAPNLSAGAAGRLIESSPAFRGCLFKDNQSTNGTSDGGAFILFDSSATFDRCEFRDNTASQFGGAIYISGNQSFMTEALVRNCLFHGNSAPSGGAFALQTLRARIRNCTFAGNDSPMGAIFANFGGRYFIDNSIVWGNTGGADQIIIDEGTGATIVMNFTLTGSAEPGFAAGTGNIDADPRFSSPALDDYHLLAGSPAIDIADRTNSLAFVGPQDIDGGPRVRDDAASPGSPPFILDLGCYESLNSPLPPPNCDGDADGNGVVNFADITSVLKNFTAICGP